MRSSNSRASLICTGDSVLHRKSSLRLADDVDTDTRLRCLVFAKLMDDAVNLLALADLVIPLADRVIPLADRGSALPDCGSVPVGCACCGGGEMSINRELGAGTHPLVLGRSRPAGGVCGGSSDVLGCGLLIWSRSTDVEYAFLMDLSGRRRRNVRPKVRRTQEKSQTFVRVRKSSKSKDPRKRKAQNVQRTTYDL